MTTHDKYTKKQDNLPQVHSSQEEHHADNTSGLSSFHTMQRAIKKPTVETLTPQAVVQLQRVVGNRATLKLLSTTSAIQRQATVRDLPNDEISKENVSDALATWHESYSAQELADQQSEVDPNRPEHKNPSYAKNEVQSMIGLINDFDPENDSPWRQTFSVAIEDGGIQAVRAIKVRGGSLDLIVANPDRDPNLGSPGPASVLIDEFGTRELGRENQPRRPNLRAEVSSLIPMYQNRFGYRLTQESWQLVVQNDGINLNGRLYPEGVLTNDELAQIRTPRLQMEKPPDE